MELIIDIQGLKLSQNEFLFKELAIVAVDGYSCFPINYLFKPPSEWDELSEEAQKENLWLEACFHGLSWNSGHVAHDEIDNILEKLESTYNHPIIYVKGLQKKMWLMPYFTEVRNLEDYDCPSLKHITFMDKGPCLYHQGLASHNCASRNVLALRKWFLWHRALGCPPSEDCGE